MATTSDETQIQIFADWPVSHAKRVTEDNRKNPEYDVVAAIRRLRADKKTVPQKNHGLLTMLKHIGSKKTYGPKNTGQSKNNNAGDRKRKCCRFTQDISALHHCFCAPIISKIEIRKQASRYSSYIVCRECMTCVKKFMLVI